MKVTFDSPKGLTVSVVTKVNGKSMIVLAEEGSKQYKISPELPAPLHEVT